jgi:hypothetical protein
VNSETLLLRQINPNFIRQGRVTSQAFTPTPKDEQRLSAYDGDRISAEVSWVHFTETFTLPSAGVMAVSVGECESQGTFAIPDPESFPEHVLIDFSELSRRKRKDAAKILRNLAEERGWQYKPAVAV